MVQLDFGQHFSRRYRKLTQKDRQLKERLGKIFECLALDPFDLSLETHKAGSRRFGKRYSSTVTDDLRIIWDFNPDHRIRLLLLDLGGHSGKHAVY